MSIFDIFKKKGTPEIDNPKIAAEVQMLAKNQIRMEVDERADRIRADGCKIGGKPFLPADFVWPTFTSTEDHLTRPLSFFCQINLAEVSTYDKDHILPPYGMLCFFYECASFCWGFDPDDRDAARVFYFENTDGFVPHDLPEDLDEDYAIPEIAVKFIAEQSYPMYEELEFHSDLECAWEIYDEALAELGANVDEDSECHKLLGYADIIQGEMLTECERAIRGLFSGDPESYQNTPADESADIQEHAKDWTLLLQLGTIKKDAFTWMFGDCGMLYYYIKKEDLAAKCFENTWFSMQCY